MKKLYYTLKPFANRYTVLIIWLLAVLNFYFCCKPLLDYGASIGSNKFPIVLDSLYYFTPDDGYEVLSNLGDQGRQAYRLLNYIDFILPISLFLSLSLPNLAMNKGPAYIIAPFLYMISDYIENLAEKYVLEIYPNRHDTIMSLACYAGLLKMFFFWSSLFILIVNGLIYQCRSTDQKQKSK